MNQHLRITLMNMRRSHRGRTGRHRDQRSKRMGLRHRHYVVPIRKHTARPVPAVGKSVCELWERGATVGIVRTQTFFYIGYSPWARRRMVMFAHMTLQRFVRRARHRGWILL